MNRQFFERNRSRLRQLAGGNLPIVVAASGILQRNGDTTFPFRQDSNFYYLTGIDEPDIVLVMEKSAEYLIVPARSSSRESFDGAVDFTKLSSVSGIGEVMDYADGWRRLKSAVTSHKKLATPLASPSYIGQYGFFTNPARARLIKKLKSLQPGLDLIDLRELLANMRMVKQPAEIDTIQQAIDITNESIDSIRNDLDKYKYEYEIEADLTAGFRSRGAAGHAFAPIVAGGKNACTLHNVSNDSPLRPGDMIVIDVGAEVDNYAADITRTVAAGKVSARHRQVHAAVLDVQNYALGLLKPGADLFAYEGKVVDYLGQKLIELGLITKNTKAAVRQYYPHSTGHFMGLDVHDAGDYRRELAENMVLTCEPGIYIPEEGIGVRIEDDVLITASGNRVLSMHGAKGL